MRGLFKRKGSDVWQGRYRIPQALWRERSRLRELGVSDVGESQEFARSTGHTDKARAEAAYRDMLTAWDAKLGAWEVLLVSGPQSLSPKQQMALAAAHAKALLAEHEDDPFEAPPKSAIPELPHAGAAMLSMLEAMEPSLRKTFEGDLREYLKARKSRKTALSFRLLKKYPGLKAVLGPVRHQH